MTMAVSTPEQKTRELKRWTAKLNANIMRKTELLSLIYEGNRRILKYQDAMVRQRKTDRDYQTLIAEAKQEVQKLKMIYSTSNDINK